MDFVSYRMAPYHPKVVLFDVAPQWVVLCGAVFTSWHVYKATSGGIMVEIDATVVAVLIPLTPCFGSVTGTGGATTVTVLRPPGL